MMKFITVLAVLAMAACGGPGNKESGGGIDISINGPGGTTSSHALTQALVSGTPNASGIENSNNNERG